MYYSAAAYCTSDILLKWACGEPCDSIDHITELNTFSSLTADTHAFVAYNSFKD